MTKRTIAIWRLRAFMVGLKYSFAVAAFLNVIGDDMAKSLWECVVWNCNAMIERLNQLEEMPQEDAA